MNDPLITLDGGPAGLTTKNWQECLEQIAQTWILDAGVERLLLVPPDHTRLYSFAGTLTAELWRMLHDRVAIDILPALGTHLPMTERQLRMMFGEEIPLDRFHAHNWRTDLKPLGVFPAEFLDELSGGRMRSPVEVAVNRRIISGGYDLVLSLGQVVPHEVIGFANHSKNICIGCGGGQMLHQSHFLGAVCGIEQVLGVIDTPVRRLMDEGFYRFVRPRADVRFLLTVVEDKPGGPALRALTAGDGSECFRWAARLSGELNLKHVDRPLNRCVVYLDPREFSSTWLGNKAIYRTRKAMADNGELIVLAPAVHAFGEDPQIDRLIRQYGYCGTPATLAALEADEDLAGNLSAAAHLIHGSTEGRFRVTYATGAGLTAEEIRSVGYEHRSYDEVAQAFSIDQLNDGWHEGPDGEPFYFIRNPALGLWSS
ncbi:lactate racemase domain-containing protein [Botrimarina hoheduenensis]|uniref:lactate racemase domain-containing protein n=1 Tax=Botrimarina hoheduenensis TaxID=2528000 RepID=UPI0018D2FB99|nr:lactate racemase domain-containing protein [Botrimarina hoheduenensis]